MTAAPVVRVGACLSVLVAGAALLSGAVAGAAAAPDGEVLRPDHRAATTSPAAATAGSEPDDRRPEAGDEVLDEIDEVLAAMAAALVDSDPEGLRGHLHDPDSAVGQRWLERAGNTAGVPFETYELRVDRRLGDLTTERVRRTTDTDVVVVAVLEEHALAGQDGDGPPLHRATLTFVDHEGAWRLADDRAGRRLGRSEPRHLWDLGPVTVTGTGSVLAVHHPDATDVETLVGETADAIDALEERWPLPWDETVTLLVPRDQEDLEHLIDAAVDLDDFLAFTSATRRSAPGVHEVTGARLIVNPGRFPAGPDARQRVLLHELVHVASRPVAAAWMPLWLEEGIAQVLGEQGPSTGHTRQLDAAGPAGRRLPTDREFTAEGREATHLAYQRSWSFVDHLVDRVGPQAVTAFYREVGASSTDPGTVDHRIDRAARDELGRSLDELVAAWRGAG